MKRFIIYITLILFTFGLTSCGAITPDDVEKISEEFCRSNPESEICKGEVLEDINDTIVKELFEDLLEDYLQNEATFCDTYFSVTNTELLDTCREEKTTLFPQDVTGYIVHSVTEITNTDNETKYEVKIKKEGEVVGYKFLFSIVGVEGTTYINSWEYSMFEFLNNAFSEADMTAFIASFIRDINDTAINSVAVANTYVLTENRTNVIDFIDDLERRELTITSHLFSITGDGALLDITLSNTDEVQFEVTFDQVSTDWYISLRRIYHLDTVTDYDKEKLLNDYILAFNTGAATDDVVCANYLSVGAISDCEALRPDIRSSSQMLSMRSLHLETNDLILDVYNSDMTIIDFHISYKIDFVVYEGALYIELSDQYIYTYPLLVDATEIFTDLVDDMMDPMLVDADFCDMWGHLFDDCATLRSLVTTEFYSVELGDIEPLSADGTYSVTLEVYDMMFILNRTIEVEVSVTINELEDPVIMGRGMSEFLVPPHDNYQTILEEFLTWYFDSTKTDDEIYDHFFPGVSFEGLYNRENVILTVESWDIKDITWHSGYGFYWYEASVGYMVEGVEEVHTVRYELFDDGVGGTNFKLMFPLVFPDDATIHTYLVNILDMIDDTTLDKEAFCTMNFVSTDYDDCVRFVTQYQYQEIVSDLDIIVRHVGAVEAYIDFTAPDDTVTRLKFNLYPQYDLLENIYLQVSISHPDTTLRDALSTYMTDAIIYMFGTHGITIDMYCLERAECGTAFDDITSDVHHLTYGSVYWDLTDFFDPVLTVHIKFSYYGADDPDEYHLYTASYTIDDDGYYNWMLHFVSKYRMLPSDVPIMTEDQVTSALVVYEFDYSNTENTDENLCAKYYYSNQNCVPERQDILAFGGVLSVSELTPVTTTSGVSAYQVTFTITYPDDSTEEETVVLNMFNMFGLTQYYIIYYD